MRKAELMWWFSSTARSLYNIATSDLSTCEINTAVIQHDYFGPVNMWNQHCSDTTWLLQTCQHVKSILQWYNIATSDLSTYRSTLQWYNIATSDLPTWKSIQQSHFRPASIQINTAVIQRGYFRPVNMQIKTAVLQHSHFRPVNMQINTTQTPQTCQQVYK